MVGLLLKVIISNPIFLGLNVNLKNNTNQISKGVSVVKILTKKIISRMDIEKKVIILSINSLSNKEY